MECLSLHFSTLFCFKKIETVLFILKFFLTLCQNIALSLYKFSKNLLGYIILINIMSFSCSTVSSSWKISSQIFLSRVLSNILTQNFYF